MSLRIAAIPSDGVSDVLGSAPVQADGTFHLRNVFGRNLLRLASLDERVWVKAVYVDGNDVSDSGIIAESGQQIHATVVLGEPEAEVSGRVSDGARSHTGNAAVIVFAATEALWTHPLNRYSRVTRSSDTGKYSLTGLPQGDYLAVALDDIDMVTAVRPAFLARLRAVATRIKFNGSSKQYVDLAVQKVLQ